MTLVVIGKERFLVTARSIIERCPFCVVGICVGVLGACRLS